MASHDQFDAAPGATPDVVPTVAQVDAVPVVALDVVPDLAPHAARHVARGGPRAIAHGGAHRVPRCTAHHVANVLTLGAALDAATGGVGSTMAPNAAPILGQAAHIDGLFAFVE